MNGVRSYDKWGAHLRQMGRPDTTDRVLHTEWGFYAIYDTGVDLISYLTKLMLCLTTFPSAAICKRLPRSLFCTVMLSQKPASSSKNGSWRVPRPPAQPAKPWLF